MNNFSFTALTTQLFKLQISSPDFQRGLITLRSPISTSQMNQDLSEDEKLFVFAKYPNGPTAHKAGTV
jgi:hypothetical protein